MSNITSILKETPLNGRPRERLVQYGEKALANHELIAILLRTGTRKQDVLTVSLNLLQTFENLFYLKNVTLEEFMTIPGIGQTKAVELKAAIELGMRISRASQIKTGQITSSKNVGELLMEEMRGMQQEIVVALYLNTKNEIIKKEEVFKGSLNSSVAHPREIFKGAVRYSAARLIVGHNHPSGNPEPSDADIQFTKRLAECGELMGIELLDHVIAGENSYISLKEWGVF